MRRPISFLIFIVFMPVGMIMSCNKNINSFDPVAEKASIENTIRSSIGWAKDKDIKLLYSVIANDDNFLEVHPEGKVVSGFKDFTKAESFWMSPDFRAVRYDISDLRINIAESGTTAWWFCILNDINEWKGQPANWENTRWTGVAEKRNGKWIIVQQHFSYAEE